MNRSLVGIAIAAWLAVGLLVAPISASRSKAQQAVDLELVLAVDVSLSMDLQEQRLQRDGYVKAFRDADLINAIAAGQHRSIAVTYIEWAGGFSQHTVVPWTLIDGP